MRRAAARGPGCALGEAMSQILTLTGMAYASASPHAAGGPASAGTQPVQVLKAMEMTETTSAMST